MQTVRSAVKLANAATKDLQATVQHTSVPATGAQDSRGEPVSPPIAVARRAIVEMKQQLVKTMGGELVQAKAKVTFLDPAVVVGVRDVIVLPDGTTGPILNTEGFVDSGTGRPILTEVYLG
jgi:hypothetical protein